MFLQTNDRLINLKNVSNINILEDRNRIIFNLNYNIEMTTSRSGVADNKLISDYVYWDALNKDNLLNNYRILKSVEYFKDNFIEQKENSGYININEISSVKFIDKKFRVIFNLSHPITFRDFNGNKKITSEFVYVNFNGNNQYQGYTEYVKNKLGEK